jgi:aspartyl protease family protein
MAALVPIAILAAAVVALFTFPAQAPILGLDHGTFARASVGAALVGWFAFMGARRAGAAGVARVIGGVAIWTALLFGLTGVYAYRFELSDFANRVIAELAPGEPEIGRGGEVIINRRLGGEFVIAAKVDDTPIPFIFDTGASTVVLRAQDAAKIGIDASTLAFDVEVVTANGAATAARTRLDKVSVGPIVLRDVRALVTRPGALTESLLGMSFLERLRSYSVERGRLVLKAK